MIASLVLLCIQDTAPAVDFRALVQSSTDASALARWPNPPYTCRQASSYDRAAIAPGQNWFANSDAGQFVRIEEHAERSEGVMLDVDGPGAVVRIWSANPAGVLRVYLDGEERPALVRRTKAWLAGNGGVPPPLAEETAHGFSSFAPIPYARHCKITCDAPKDLYYHVDYRTYAPETSVQSFDVHDLETQRAVLEKTCAELLRPVGGGHELGFTYSMTRDDPHGQLLAPLPETSNGPRAISEIRFTIEAKDVALALRQTILHMRFDGEETVTCPLGDFFASAPGLNPFSSFPITIDAAGDLRCRFVMPYRTQFDLACENRGSQEMHVAAIMRTIPWKFDDRSMHFHACWRTSGPLRTRPKRDWRHAGIEGRGVLVGDMLSVANPSLAWWGEGDEKIYVDGEKFPSHFGTGTEDYYGYAWCDTALFQAPFHAQTRCDGPANFGYTSVNRFRMLDAIPFEKSLCFDMELWHWKDAEVELAATVFFYALPGAHDDSPPIRAEDLRITDLAPKLFRVLGAIEAEDLHVLPSTPKIRSEPQVLVDTEAGGWSGARQLFVRASEVHQYVDIRVPVANPGRHEVILYPTKSFDYATLQCYVDGKIAGPPLQTFNAQAHAAAPPEPCSLGTFDLGASFTLRVEVAAIDPRSDPPHTYFGIDCIVLR